MNPNISILIVDDDMKKIANIIDTIKNKIKETPLKIDQAVSISEAKEYLFKNKYHLLISDLQMPLHKDGDLLPEGGEILVKEIYRKRNNLNVPLYIFGLTGYRELILNFSNLWKVFYYHMSEEAWKVYLRDLIFHIDLIKSNLVQYLIETIYVEGINDYKLLSKTIDCYFKDKLTEVKIEYLDFSGGADWVERKIIVWGKSLNKKEDESYLKAVGLFDNDIAGFESINSIRSTIKNNSAESRTFSLLTTSMKYSPILKSLKSKGIEFYSTMEDLIGINVWKEAKERDWLEKRKSECYLGTEKVDDNLLNSKNLNSDEMLIATYKVKDKYKDSFTNLALNDIGNLVSVSYLVKDCLEKLKILSPS